MPRRHDDEEDLDPREYPEAEDADGDDTDTDGCPYCGAEVYEDAERCPSCDTYISREDAPPRMPRWIFVTAIVCLVIALGWVFGWWW
jgi:hypothetical protein